MTISTDDIFRVYLETGSYQDTATRLGLGYDAVRKRIRRHLPPGSSTLVAPGDTRKLQWLRAPKCGLSMDETISQVKEALFGYKPPASFPRAPKRVDADLATIYPLADWHIGLLSWGQETGTDYDLRIAREVITKAMAELIAVSPRSDQAVLLGLGDLLHSDNFDGTTARSRNVLDTDGRYPKILSEATQIILQVTYAAMRKHGKVLVRILPGNHDQQSAACVSLALSMHFHNEPRVTVDMDAGPFWWWQWGSVLLGATHGDKAKMPKLPNIMADEASALWGKTHHRHIFTGHIHQRTCIEERGVTVESFQSPVAQDAWHRGMGYRGNRSVQSITYHKTDGEVKRDRINVT